MPFCKCFAVIFLVLAFSCKSENQRRHEPPPEEIEIGREVKATTDSVSEKDAAAPASQHTTNLLKPIQNLPDSTFVDVSLYATNFAYDLRYATPNNFLKRKLYNCARCFLRVRTLKALLKAQVEFAKKGVRIKFFDCYRPHHVQWEMWKIVPNPAYVADPKLGSIHNKGSAVDITLVDSLGSELPMGTDYDFFGPRAHHKYRNLSEEVLANRNLLKETMLQNGFGAITTEWWHYSLKTGLGAPIANFKWPCPDKKNLD